MSNRETKHHRAIRQRAERMWHEDGCPRGQMDEYLERARELHAIEDNPGAGRLPNPMAVHNGQVEPGRSVEEAALQENLGEFPNLLNDQGERLSTPMTRKDARRAMKNG